MIKLFFLMIFLLIGPYSLKAQETMAGDDVFMKQLSSIKNPFEDGYPVAIVLKKKEIYHPPPHKKFERPKPKPKPPAPPVVLPKLDLQGVMVGEEMHQAIINDEVVPLFGSIMGAKVIAVSNAGVKLLYKGKKFFLKVD